MKAQQAARLVADNGAVSFALSEGISTVGRADRASGWAPTIDLSALDTTRKSSRRHAEIRRTPKGALIRDLGSSNRTFLNGQPLTPNTDYPLSEGDVLKFGEVLLSVVGIGARETGLRCPKCNEPVSEEMPTCLSCGANLTASTMSIELGAKRPCFRCGRPTRGDELCPECAEAIAEADRELLALSGLKRKKG